MRVFLKLVAALCVAVGLFLIYAVIHAMASSGGARAGIVILYIVLAAGLGYAASWLWRRSSRAKAAPA